MAQVKRIMISLPDSLLAEVDGFIRRNHLNRSEFIREAVRRYMEEHRRRELRQRMKEGYLEMAELNLTLAEGAVAVDSEVFENYEGWLGNRESERPDDN